MYLINPPQLDRQKNALRVEVIPPMSRCALRPKDDNAVILRRRLRWRTDQLARIWDDFDYCTGSNCEDCPIYKQHHQERRCNPPAKAVIRRDPIHRHVWWFLPDAESGWNRFGYAYRSLHALLEAWQIDLGELKRDETGAYWTYIVRKD